MTICEVKRNSALDRVRAVLETGTDPGSLLGKQGLTSAQPPDEDADAEDYAVDIEDIANQQIVSLIKSEFAGHALADLVAEILRVEEYTTKVSPPLRREPSLVSTPNRDLLRLRSAAARLQNP